MTKQIFDNANLLRVLKSESKNLSMRLSNGEDEIHRQHRIDNHLSKMVV